jgi:hypothetical protein
MIEKLKHCPFCGGEVHIKFVCEEEIVVADDGDDGSNSPCWVHCNKCGMDYFPESDELDEVATEWNKRSADSDNLGWIPVSKPPKISGNYLCSLRKVCEDNNTYEEWVDKRYFDKKMNVFPMSWVVAWQPLPEPYKEGKHANTGYKNR